MEDKQLLRKPVSTSIPVLSPILHVLAMPVLVFLRHDFGYLFLRPKSIFLALIWAFVLYAAYSFYEPEIWNANLYVSLSCGSCALIYVVHLIRAVVSQLGKAPHDQFAGRSHFQFLGIPELILFLWFEPILVSGVAIFFQFTGKGHYFSQVLGMLALTMFAKELINRWSQLRKGKQQVDATDDAEEIMGKVANDRDSGVSVKASVGSSTRRARQKRKRARGAVGESEDAVETHAVVLRMIPPYTLEQAESNFRSLVKQFHPDESEQDPEGNAGLVELTSARDFFRQRFNEN